MGKFNINNVENVEGKYHLMFFEGKNMVESAKNEIRYALIALLFFLAMVVLFVVISGFNIFYLGFVALFLIVFLVTYILLKRQKSIGKKQCIYAVQNSNAREIIAKQVDSRKTSKIVSKSVSNKLDKFDTNETRSQRKLRKQKQKMLASKIREFEKEEKK